MYELREEVRKTEKSAEYNDILFEVVNSKADPDVLKRYKAWEESSGYVLVNNRLQSKKEDDKFLDFTSSFLTE